MDIIPENNSYKITLKFYDGDGLPVTPTSLTYSVNDESSNTAIISKTTVTPTSSEYVVSITKIQNKIIDESNPSEKKILTYDYTYNVDEGSTGTVEWTVQNLKYITST